MNAAARRALHTAALLLGTAVSAPSAQAARYTLDVTHTMVNFEAAHENTSVLRGRFEKTSGSISFDRNAQSGQLDFTLDMHSLSTGVALLDQRLLGPAYFDSAAFPNARFVSQRLSFSGSELKAVAGVLTLHGQQHALTLQARRFNCYTSPLFLREVCGGDFEATLQPSRWGLGTGLPGVPEGWPDSIRVRVQVEAVKQ